MHIVVLKLMLNNKTHGSEYNDEVLEGSLKAYYYFDFLNNARTVIRNMENSAIKVADYFSEYSEQVNCETNQINGAMKYGFGMLENT